MKLNIHDANRPPSHTFTNVNSLPFNNFWQRVALSCSKGEASEIVLDYSIHSWDKTNLVQNMRSIIELMDKGATITVCDFDFLLTCDFVLRDYGVRDTAIGMFTKCRWIYDMGQIKDLLKSLNITITNSFYSKEDLSFTLIGVKQ